MATGVQTSAPRDVLGMSSSQGAESSTTSALGNLQAEFLSAVDRAVPPIIGGTGTPTSMGKNASANNALETVGLTTYLNFHSPYSDATRKLTDENFARLPGAKGAQNPNQTLEQK